MTGAAGPAIAVDDLVFDLHGARFWGGHPYGQAILGTHESVAGMPVQALRELHAAHASEAGEVPLRYSCSVHLARAKV